MRRLMLLAAALVLAACNTDGAVVDPGELAVETLYIAAHKVPCSGEGITQCLLVRRDPQAEWQYFYDGIEGFVYVEGFTYTLRVAVTEIPNPPADGSSRAYRLLEVVSKHPE
jgi:hypothetical protein